MAQKLSEKYQINTKKLPKSEGKLMKKKKTEEEEMKKTLGKC